MTIKTLRPALAVLLAMTSAACTGEPSVTTDPVTRTDSAGVEIVTHLAELDTATMETVGDPVLVIGSGEGEGDAVLFQLSAVIPLEEGRLVVGSSGTRTVLVFDGAGRLERTIGGPGEGPGEFGMVSDVVVLGGDSVVVLDIKMGRITVFDPSGELARTVDVATFLPPSRGARLRTGAGGLWLVGVASLGAEKTPGAFRHSATTWRLSATGDSLGAFGPFPGSEAVITHQLAGILPFGATLVSGVRDDRLIIGLESQPELLEFVFPDRPARIIRWPDHDRAVTAERAEAFIDFQLTELPAALRSKIGPGLRDMPHSPVQPAYHDLIVASDGVIWLGDYPGPEAMHPEAPPSARTWTLIDPDGVRRRVVRTPAGFALRAVRDGRVYGVHRDDLGVESVRVYEVP